MKYLKNIEKKIILTLLNTTLQAGNILPKYNKYTRYFSLGQRNKLFIFNLKYSFYQIKKSFLFILELAALRQKILFINLDNNVKFERFIDTKKFSSTRLNVFTSFFIRNKIVYVSGEWRPGSISNIQQHVRSPDIKWKNLYKGLYGLNNRKIYPYEHISLRRSYSYKTSWEETKKRKKLKKRLDVCVIPYIGAYKWYYKLFRKIAFKNFKSRYIPLVASESIIKQSKKNNEKKSIKSLRKINRFLLKNVHSRKKYYKKNIKKFKIIAETLNNKLILRNKNLFNFFKLNKLSENRNNIKSIIFNQTYYLLKKKDLKIKKRIFIKKQIMKGNNQKDLFIKNLKFLLKKNLRFYKFMNFTKKIYKNSEQNKKIFYPKRKAKWRFSRRIFKLQKLRQLRKQLIYRRNKKNNEKAFLGKRNRYWSLYLKRNWKYKSIKNFYIQPSLPSAAVMFNPSLSVHSYKETNYLQLPSIGILDSDQNPFSFNYPILGNDKSLTSIAYLTKVWLKAIKKGSFKEIFDMLQKENDFLNLYWRKIDIISQQNRLLKTFIRKLLKKRKKKKKVLRRFFMKKLSRSIENRLLKVRNQLIVRKDLMKHHSKNIILPKKQDLDWLKNNEKKIIYFLKLYKLSSKLETFPDYKKKYIKNKIKYLKIKNKRFKILNCDENKLLSKIVKRKKYYNTYNIKIKKKSR